MTNSRPLTKPLPRTLTLFVLLVALSAFLPHRERALLLSGQGLDAILSAETLAGNSFFAPAPVGYYSGGMIGWPSIGDSPAPLRRERFASGRPLAGSPLLADSAMGPSAANDGPGFLPLGNAANSAAPVFAAATSTPPAAIPARFGPGATGSFPGGGGGIITGPIQAIVPPPTVSPVPEPGIWALMILGFGLIGSGIRRKHRAASRDTSGQTRPVT